MPPVPLIKGAYRNASVIANAQRCVNLYSELNSEDATEPVTHYPTPGLVSLRSAPTSGEGRGLYVATNGQLYGVVGNKLYNINNAYSFIEVGTLQTSTGPVKMADNRITMLVVDGSAYGYTVALNGNAFGSPTGAGFNGGNYVDIIDSFFILNRPNSDEWFCSSSNSVDFPELYFSTKSGVRDNINSIISVDREIWIMGALKASELWYNAGNADFPFQIISGAYIGQSNAAPYSLARYGSLVFWLAGDDAGNKFVARGVDYRPDRVSTPAIEYAISTYGDVSDAIGMMYAYRGHPLYVLTFPSADKTWVFDTSTNEWHEWVWLDTNGNEHRHRANCMASAFGKHLCLDWENGALMELSSSAYDDLGEPIIRRRGYPHLVSDGNDVIYNYFRADMDCGNIAATLSSDAPEISLRWSDSRGHSWQSPLKQNFGASGEYNRQVQWSRLGKARDRVFELYWSTPAFTAVQGAWVMPEMQQGEQSNGP